MIEIVNFVCILAVILVIVYHYYTFIQTTKQINTNITSLQQQTKDISKKSADDIAATTKKVTDVSVKIDNTSKSLNAKDNTLSSADSAFSASLDGMKKQYSDLSSADKAFSNRIDGLQKQYSDLSNAYKTLSTKVEAPAPAPVCRALATQWDDMGGGNTAFFDRHDIKCNDDERLVQQRLGVDWGSKRQRFNYKCCK
jgi:uncharacterized phage infection (PIP) family protein YhgE